MLQTRMFLAGLYLICSAIPVVGQLAPRMRMEQPATHRVREKSATSLGGHIRVGQKNRPFRYRITQRSPDFIKRDFSDGLAAVLRGDKWGYIDKTGKVVIEPQYILAERFSEGLAAVRIGDKFGYIDRNGEVVITPQYVQASSFAEGLAAVRIGDKYGYIDQSGKLVIDPRFDVAWTFSEGLACVEIDTETGYIDHTGNVVIRLPSVDLWSADDFSEGLAVVTLMGDKIVDFRNVPVKYVYVDKSGNLIDQPGALGPGVILGSGYYGGLALAFQVVEGKLGKIGYSDRDGNLVINPQFELARPFFNQDLAAVRLNGKWGYIDKTGNLAIAPQYEGASDFSEGLASVRMGDRKYGYIDRTGKVVIDLPADVGKTASSKPEPARPIVESIPFSKNYLQMTEAERLAFIERSANNVAWNMVGHGRQLSFTKSGARLIKPYVEEYAKRVGNKSAEPWREDLQAVFERAIRQAPHIIRAFKSTDLAPVIGLTLALLESEYHPCLDTPDGRKGLFLFTPESARAAGLLPTDRCDAPKSAQAAARSLAGRRSEFGAEGVGIALSVLSHRHGLELIKRDFQGVLRSTDQNNSFWELFATPSREHPGDHSYAITLPYSLRFFAAAIIGENPESFGLQIQPLSTYTREVK